MRWLLLNNVNDVHRKEDTMKLLTAISAAALSLSLASLPAMAGPSGQHSAASAEHSAAAASHGAAAVASGVTTVVAVPVVAVGSALVVTGAALESVGDSAIGAGVDLSRVGAMPLHADPAMPADHAPKLD
jgi:hypothetical protein